MYERTTTSPHIAVSNVLSGAGDFSTSAQKLNIPTPRFSVFSRVSPHSSMFTSVSDCVINVNVTSSSASE